MANITRRLASISEAAIRYTENGAAAGPRPYCGTSVIFDQKATTKSGTISKLHGVFAKYQKEK